MNRKIDTGDDPDDIEPANFKMRMDEDPAIHKEIEAERIDKLNQRITLMAIIIPCAIIALIVMGYIHINKMVIRFKDTGTATVQNLSKDVETRLADLTAQLAKLKESTNAELASLKKKAAAQASGISEADTALKNIRSSKADAKDVQSSMDSMSKTIGQIKKDLEAALAEVKKTTASLSKTDADIKQIKAGLSDKIDKKTFDLALEKEGEKTRKSMNDLEREFVAIQTKMVKLERLLEAEKAKNTVQPKPEARPAPKPATPAAKPAAPTAGKIIEQDIN